MGFVALAVALQQSLRRVEYLEKDEKHADYEVIKREWTNYKTSIDELKIQISGLESSLNEKSGNLMELATKNEELKKEKEILIKEKNNMQEKSNSIITILEEKYKIQVDAHSQCDAVQVQMQQEILHLRDDNERLKKQLAVFVEADSKDSRLQASITRCGELEDEVRSLQSVLELRHQELQELRKNNGSLSREVEQLQSALQRVGVLQARVEDLEAQLKDKGDMERQAAQQHCALMEALQKEANHRNRLTLQNEELQWKLRQNAEVFNALVNGTSANIQVPSISGTSSPAVSRKNTNGLLHSISESTSPAKASSETTQRLSVSTRTKLVNNTTYQTLRSDVGEELSSPPSSPRMKVILSKNDSVSWVLDMEESSNELASRLVRRANSFRGNTPPPSTSSSPHTLRSCQPTSKRRSAVLRSNSIHNDMDMILTKNLSSELEKDSCENGEQNWNYNMPDFSNDESPTKSSGSSAYTSSDEDVRNNIDGKNIVSDESYCHSDTSSHLQNVLPFSALNICGSPNTAELSLLAACAAAQPALIPKDSAGEAMISEETSEDENDRDEVDDH